MTALQLKRLLVRAGLSQRGLSRALGINERHVRRLIADEVAISQVLEIAIRCVCEHRAEPQTV